MKRSAISLCLIISVLLTLAVLPAYGLEAKNIILTLTAGSWYESEGDEYIDVTLSFQAETGIAGFDIRLDYNRLALEPLKNSGGSIAASGTLSLQGVEALKNPDKTTGRIRFIAAQASNSAGMGTLFKLTFKKKSGYSGDNIISFSVDPDSTENKYSYTYKREDGNWTTGSLIISSGDSILTAKAVTEGTGFFERYPDGLVKTADSISYSVDIASSGDSGYTGEMPVVLAFYDGERMTGIKACTVTVEKNSVNTVTFSDIGGFISASEDMHIKVFFLNSDLVPLAPPIEH